MREIKFRVWDKKYKTFDYNASPDIFISTEGEPYEKDERVYGMQTYTEYNRSTDYELMQYTGFEGIYEGDILYGEEIGEYGSILSRWKGLVYWDEEKCGFYVKDPDDIDDAYRLDDYDYSKIIGNIYENPKLLES